MDMRFIVTLATVLSICGAPHARQQSPVAQDSHAEMVQRGDHIMGFSAAKTTHHFRLIRDGGAIEVSPNDAKDSDSRNHIRMHLSHLTSMLSEGNLNIPMLVHDTTPPGAATISKLHGEIRYEYEETTAGARIRIITENAQALDAVHAFLLFQVIEHRTGDSGVIEPN